MEVVVGYSKSQLLPSSACICGDILNGNESSCIHRLGSNGKSILPRSQSEPSVRGGSVVEPASVWGPDELDVPGSPLDVVCDDELMTRLASRWSSPRMML